MKFFLSFPMLSCFVLGVALVAMSYQYKRLASILIIAVIISQYLFATPLMTKLLFMVIGRYPPLSLAQLKQQNPQAIIILGGGLYKGQEYNNVYQAGLSSIVRLQYGAYLANALHLDVALSGMEADYGMKNTLAQLGIQAKWSESHSFDTHQNAQLSAKLLQQQGIKKVILVTDAWHMSRAVLAFTHAGFDVIAAPTEFPEGFYQQQQQWWQPSLILYSQHIRGWTEVFGHIKYNVRYHSEKL